MKVKVLRNFYDKTADLQERQIGEELEVSKERADFLIAREYAQAIKEPAKKAHKEAKEA